MPSYFAAGICKIFFLLEIDALRWRAYTPGLNLIEDIWATLPLFSIKPECSKVFSLR